MSLRNRKTKADSYKMFKIDFILFAIINYILEKNDLVFYKLLQ